MQELHENARKNIQSTKERNKITYDKRISAPIFKEGDKVLLYDEALRRDRSRKLESRWRGPYEIIKIKGVNCILRITKNKTIKVHLNRVKLFY
jgi:hypothetical protein